MDKVNYQKENLGNYNFGFGDGNITKHPMINLLYMTCILRKHE